MANSEEHVASSQVSGPFPMYSGYGDENLGVAPVKNEGWVYDGERSWHPNDPSAPHTSIVRVSVKHFNNDEEELDDPYLELFDRINQLEMDVKELTSRFNNLFHPTNHLIGKTQSAFQSEFKFFE